MLTAFVHPRLGLPSFERFQPYFIAGLRALEAGNECVVNIDGGLSPATIAARMRDSLHGFRINASLWSQSVDPEFVSLFTKWDGQFTISGPDLDGLIVIRPKRQVGRKSASGASLSQHDTTSLGKFLSTTVRPPQMSTAVQTGLDDSITAPNNERDTVMRYVEMKSAGLLPVAIKFIGKLSIPIVEEIINYDVALSYDEQRNITILL